MDNFVHEKRLKPPQIVTTLDLSDCQLDDEALGRYVYKYKFEKIVLEDQLI